MFPLSYSAPIAQSGVEQAPKPLIRFRFVALCDGAILHRSKAPCGFMTKDFAGELFITR